MSRVQLALNVSNIDEAIAFYSKAFSTKPAKVRKGYANFAISEPPLKLVLIESEQGGTLNHLGVEVEGSEQVAAMSRRLVDEGLTTEDELGVECCYARQDKVWVKDPDGAEWEWYTVLGDSNIPAKDTACC
ncbi:MAG: VOC family protein [Acidobacteria bacterium]|nr:VOC family protein [Acidobacteriota bacterium]